MLTAAVLMAMWDFCQAFPSSAEGVASPLPIPLLKAAQLIEARLAEPLTLDDLARGAGIGKGRLIQLARQHWHTTPIERLWVARLERAARLLRETGLTISEVADACGFSNPFHFSRRFKQRFGQQPSAWRKAEWNVEERGAAAVPRGQR